MQSQADILLLLTWNTTMSRGILTGKLYEYMLAEKPILCITCGNVPYGEATETIQHLRLGFAIEEVSSEEQIEKLENWLLQQLKLKQQKMPLLFDPDKQGIAEFDHDKLVKKLTQIMENTVR